MKLRRSLWLVPMMLCLAVAAVFAAGFLACVWAAVGCSWLGKVIEDWPA